MTFPWTALGVTTAIIFGFTTLAAYAIKKEDQETLAISILELNGKSFSTIIRGLNRLFLDLFDRLYRGSYDSCFNRFIWYFVFIGMTFSLSMSPAKPQNISVNTLNGILTLSVINALSISAGVKLSDMLKARFGSDKKIIFDFMFLIVGLAGGGAVLVIFAVGTIEVGTVLVTVVGIGAAGAVVGAVRLGTAFATGLLAILVVDVRVVMKAVGSGTSGAGLLLAVAGIATTGLFLLSRYFENKINIKSKDWDESVFRRLSNISAPRVAMTSILAILAFSIIRTDVSLEYVRLIRGGEFILLLFPVLNLYADCFSVHETRLVLKLAGKWSLWLLPILLVGDLLLSGALFAVIPLVSTSWTTIWQAISFQGEQPYLGIFFWSTFSTSAMFYLFMASSLIVTIFYIPIKGILYSLTRLEIEKFIIHSMGFVLVLLTCAGFGTWWLLVGGG